MGTLQQNEEPSSSGMKIEALYTYPIKSMRGVSLPSASLTRYGLPYDRSFLLLRTKEHGQDEVIVVSSYPAMSLFSTAIDSAETTLTVTFNSPDRPSANDSLELPLLPDVSALKEHVINLNQSPTVGHEMPSDVNAWFSTRLGFEVLMLHLEPQRHREVLGNLAPNAAVRNARIQAARNAQQQHSWVGSAFSRLTSLLPGNIESEDEIYGITFADCAPYLVVSQTSVDNVSRRLPEGVDMDRTKFRPNIVVSGAPEAWEEDYWAELHIISSSSSSSSSSPSSVGSGSDTSSNRSSPGAVLACTANCLRCPSLNVNYQTGKYDKDIQPLKALQVDRRVDKGAKYSPCFGRYSFLMGCGDQGDSFAVSVGDSVEVSKRNSERTTIKWPGFFGFPADNHYPV